MQPAILMKLALKPILLVALTSSGLLACGSNDQLTALRIVHASPGAPAVDVFAAGVTTPLATNLAYGQASPYLALDPGDYSLVVTVAGTDTIVYTTPPINLNSSDRYTSVAMGYPDSTDPSNSFRVLSLREDFSSSSDHARAVFVNASPDAPTIDIDIDDDGSFDVPSLPRFDATDHDGESLTADALLQLAIGVSDVRLTAFTTPTLAPGEDLFLIATGNVGQLPRDATGFSMLAVGPSSVISMIKQNPTVYALHASPDAPAFDIRAGASGVLLYADLSFGEMIPAQVPPGDYAFAFYPAGATGTGPITTIPVTGVAAGERYLAVPTGMLTPTTGEQPFQLPVYREEFAVDGSARIRSINVSPDAPPLDISTVTGTTINTPTLVRDLAFVESSAVDGLVVPSTPSIPIGVAPTNTNVAIATFDLNTTGTPRDFMLVAGAVSPTPDEQGLRLFVVDTAARPWSYTTIFQN